MKIFPFQLLCEKLAHLHDPSSTKVPNFYCVMNKVWSKTFIVIPLVAMSYLQRSLKTKFYLLMKPFVSAATRQ